MWKEPPNAIHDELAGPDPDEAGVAALTARLAGWTPWFEGLLSERDHLLGDTLTAADIVAFPFLKVAAGPLEPGDEDLFHCVLVERAGLDDLHVRLRDWIERMDQLPRA